jgi:hypothetical protein
VHKSSEAQGRALMQHKGRPVWEGATRREQLVGDEWQQDEGCAPAASSSLRALSAASAAPEASSQRMLRGTRSACRTQVSFEACAHAPGTPHGIATGETLRWKPPPGASWPGAPGD